MARRGARDRVVRAVMRAVSPAHRALYRASGGRLGGSLGDLPILLLTATGRRSGRPRTVPLGYLRDPEDPEALVVVASQGGLPVDPPWFRNLVADPRVRVEVGRERRPMVAAVASSEERARLWPVITARYPPFAAYQRRTARQIPVVLLRPAAPASAERGRIAEDGQMSTGSGRSRVSRGDPV